MVSTIKQTPVDAIDWDDPDPLYIEAEQPQYPINALPPIIRDAVIEVQGYVQAPVAMVATCALTSVSTACQGFIDVARDSHLVGPVSLYFLTLGESGERKTTCQSAFGAGIEQYQTEATEKLSDEIKRYRSDKETHKARCAGLLQEIKKLAASGKSTEAKENQHRQLIKSAPAKPKVPDMPLTDATPEALAFSLKENWPAAAIVSDEGGAVFGGHGMGKDSVMRYLATLNTLWGAGTLRINRRTSESFEVRNSRLTFHTQLQPAALNEFLDRSGDLARGSGFLARCLISIPKSTQGSRLYMVPPANTPALDKFNNRLCEILSSGDPLNEHEQLEPALMQLSPEAKSDWVKFHDTVECELRTGGEFEDLRDSASKVADNAVRLAALFSYMESKSPATPITSEHMQSGVAVATWHLYESKRFFAELAVSDEQRNVVRLNDWLVQYCIDKGARQITRREIQQLGPSRTRDKDRRDRTLEALERANRVALLKEGSSDVVFINPALFSGGKL